MGLIRASRRFSRRRRNPGRRFSLQDKVLQVLQTKTQQQAAAELGISARTIRRWLKGDVKQPSRAHIQQLNKRAGYARQKAYRSGAPKNIPVPPKIDHVGRQDFADVKKMRVGDVNDYIYAEASKMRAVRFLVRVPKSKDYPNGVASTEWADLSGMTGGAINNTLKRARQQGEIVGVYSVDPDDLGYT